MRMEKQFRLSDPGLVAACGLAWILAGLLPALYFFRFLYADGAYFFLQILEQQAVFFPAEGRAATYVLTQWPAPVAIAAGCSDIRWLAGCFGAGLMLTPAILHGASLWLLLRKGWEAQAVVYLAMVFLLMGFGGLCIVTDSHTPTALFLLTLVGAVSFAPEHGRSWLPLLAAGLLSWVLYEFWAFYAVGMGIILGWRLWPRWPGLSRQVRTAGVLALLVFAASAGIHAWRLSHASDNPNQSSLLQMLHGTTYPVYLALITAWFLGVCAHVGWATRFRDRSQPGWIPSSRARLWVLGVSFALLLILCAIQHPTMIRYSYPFRTLNLILPLAYGGWLMAVARGGETARMPAGGRALLVWMTLALIASETWMTAGWREYQAWAGEVSRVEPGVVHVDQPPATPMAQAWIYPWSHSAQSFLAQALWFGRVRAVGCDPGAGWDPYGPGHEESLRQIAEHHGVQWELENRE